MKEQFNNIDELLRSGLEGYEIQPSPGVWKRIAALLFFSGKGFYLLLAALVLISSGTIYYFEVQDKSIKEIVNTDLPAHKETSMEANSIDQKENTLPEKNNRDIEMMHANQVSPTQQTHLQERTTKQQSASQISALPNQIIADKQSKYDQTESTSNINNYPNIERLTEQKPVTEEQLRLQDFQKFDLYYLPQLEMQNRSFYNHLKFRFDDDYGKQINLLFGLHATPELIFNAGNKQPSDPVWNFDLTGYYYKNDWFIQAGVGIGFAKDKGIFDVNYAQYDSIGYYDAVQSFSIDESTGTPVFQTHQEALWDTVEYHLNQTTSNQYTYLRLPVYFGLRLYELKRFSVYLKAGGIYSILLERKEPGLEYTNDNASWIKITNETPNRLTTNFQVSAGVALQYRLSNTFALSAEPMYNYYFNPVYRKGQESASWSLGLRTGIIFKLRSK